MCLNLFYIRRAICSKLISSCGYCDYVDDKCQIENVAPAFRVNYIIRHIDKQCADDILIEVNDHNRRQFSFIVSTANFYDKNESIKKVFSENRLVLSLCLSDRDIIEHLIYNYETCLQKNLILYSYDVIGWYTYEDKEYFLYDNTIFADGSKGFSSRKISFRNGDKAVYEKFLQNVVYKRKELSLAMAIGYSADITAKLKDTLDLGTVIVNLCGASSTGKSTAEMLMVSPFACPEISNKSKGFAFTAHSTQNALFSRINGLYGVPFVIDDIITNPYLDYSNLVYTISTCEEKSRCNSDGSVKESNFGWNGVAITSSELPITEYTKQDMGIKARVLLTQGITWTENAEQAEQIKRTILQNYGFTGKEFADFIGELSDDDLMKKFFESKEYVNTAMSKRDNLTDRIANKIAVIHLTVKLMNACFDLTLNSDDITDLLVACDQSCVDERDPAKKALECIESFIYEKHTHFNIYYNSSFFCINSLDTSFHSLEISSLQKNNISFFVRYLQIRSLLRLLDLIYDVFIFVIFKWNRTSLSSNNKSNSRCISNYIPYLIVHLRFKKHISRIQFLLLNYFFTFFHRILINDR